MIGELINHLWQSTLVAGAAYLLSFLFRGERAEVRYWLWLGASCKFLLPFSVLMTLGNYFAPISSVRAGVLPPGSSTMEQFAQPFPLSSLSAFHTAQSHGSWILVLSVAMWACGFGIIALIRLQGWLRIRAAVVSSAPTDIQAAVEVRSSRGLMEPGVVGLFRPILLLPAGIVERLTPSQLRAVLAHESCHIRRRDNLTASIHMVVEALFWFHPLIWWIGARLLQERERACDEAVLTLGNEPQVYAEGILEVCKSYLVSPLSCISGVTGADLRERVDAILAGKIARDLTFSKKVVLTTAGLAMISLPILAGSLTPLRTQANSPGGANRSTFESASIHACPAFRRNTPDGWSPGRLRSQCTTVERLIEQAYGLFETGRINSNSSVTVTGGPAWTSSDLYEIDVKSEDSQSREVMNGPTMQTLLERRFKLKVHREARDVAVYNLTVGRGGTPPEPFTGNCRTRGFDDRPSEDDCGTASGDGNGFNLKAATMADLCAGFLVLLDRPVIDKTGLAGRFNMRVDLSGEDPSVLERPRSLPALSDPFGSAPTAVNFGVAKAAMEKIGLELNSANAPGAFIVIDQIERPWQN